MSILGIHGRGRDMRNARANPFPSVMENGLFRVRRILELRLPNSIAAGIKKATIAHCGCARMFRQS